MSTAAATMNSGARIRGRSISFLIVRKAVFRLLRPTAGRVVPKIFVPGGRDLVLHSNALQDQGDVEVRFRQVWIECGRPAGGGERLPPFTVIVCVHVKRSGEIVPDARVAWLQPRRKPQQRHRGRRVVLQEIGNASGVESSSRFVVFEILKN